MTIVDEHSIFTNLDLRQAYYQLVRKLAAVVYVLDLFITTTPFNTGMKTAALFSYSGKRFKTAETK